jgi:hypothetical protein
VFTAPCTNSTPRSWTRNQPPSLPLKSQGTVDTGRIQCRNE